MPRDARAYLADVIDSCDAILSAVEGLDFEGYQDNRLVRSAVEREFTIIGEAVLVLSRIAPDVFASISHARRIVDFRNQLTHEYSTVSDMLVWGVVERDVPVLRTECSRLLERLDSESASL